MSVQIDEKKLHSELLDVCKSYLESMGIRELRTVCGVDVVRKSEFEFVVDRKLWTLNDAAIVICEAVEEQKA